MITNFYVDGFNLFYGALKGSPYKWLDLDALARALTPSHEVGRIRYFTARVARREKDPLQPERQDVYLRALGTIPHLDVHLGRYLTSFPRMALRRPVPGVPPVVEVIKSEEKGSDVNLASYLLIDAFRGGCEQSVVITNDSDLAMPIEFLSSELGIPVWVVNPRPAARRSRALRASYFRQLRPATLARCQFPSVLQEASGRTIRKPDEW